MELYEIKEIRERLLLGKFGLELESHRVTPDAHMSRVDHPFPGNHKIVRDFSEDHIEINTDPSESPEEVLDELGRYVRLVQKTISEFDPPERLWYSSNPPKIIDESDIVYAKYPPEERWNTVYRESLSNRYGRYLMTYAGIHFNYSFDEELLHLIWENRAGPYEKTDTYREFHDRFYLDLAEKAAYYGWIAVVLTAASPLLDSSFYEKSRYGGALFSGFASPRCSEIGYWNLFAPVFDYTDVNAYADKIQSYADDHILDVGRELYFPIRLKPPGAYTIEGLKEKGISHIELRMIDINPYAEYGIDLRDIKFLQYFLIWLASLEPLKLTARQQTQVTQNYKRAARYDLDIAKVCLHTDEDTHQPEYIYGKAGWPKITDDEIALSVREASLDILGKMKDYFAGYVKYAGENEEILEIIKFQEDKITSAGVRYAERVREDFDGEFLDKVLAHSGRMQDIILGDDKQ